LPQTVERLVKGNDLARPSLAGDEFLIQRQDSGAASPFPRQAFAGMVHDYLAHCLGSGPEEVRAILPADAVPVSQFEVGFVNQGRRLQHVIAAHTTQSHPSQKLEFAVNSGDQLFLGVPLPLPEPPQ